MDTCEEELFNFKEKCKNTNKLSIIYTLNSNMEYQML